MEEERKCIHEYLPLREIKEVPSGLSVMWGGVGRVVTKDEDKKDETGVISRGKHEPYVPC